jgi:DNA-binding GntR family transcriptional regulator
MVCTDKVSKVLTVVEAPVSIAVDRSSPVPLYFQVAEQLEQAIETGSLPAGVRLGNEVQLAEHYGLSRPTMRRAIQYLVDKGLLVRKRGVGTQVLHTKVKRPIELTSLYDDLAGAGQAPRTQVLQNTVVSADATVAVVLGVEPESPVVFLERLRSAGDEPLALMRNYLPADLIELTTAALESNGLYQLLRAAGINPRVALQSIGARAAKAAEARLLTEPRGAPLLTMTRTTYDDSGKAVEYGSHVYRASRYAFEHTLVGR